MDNRIVYLTGTDGCGKTTFLKDIESSLVNKGIHTKYIWLRSPKKFSKPLMAYCRLTSLTKYKTIDSVKYGRHEFYRSPFVSWLFPYVQLLDFVISWFLIKIRVSSSEVILFDRFAIDTLADLMVDTHRMDLHKTWVGKQLIKQLPLQTQVIFLFASEKTIRERKKDTRYDQQLQLKINVYNILSQYLGYSQLDNNRDFQVVRAELLNSLGI